jgi:hypothetical protein
MKESQIQNRNFEAIGWGALFVWWGITELVHFLPEGAGALGVGVILLGINAIRSINGIPTSSFSTALGILALVWGGLEMAGAVLNLPFELPIFPILLITLGVIILWPEVMRSRNE